MNINYQSDFKIVESRQGGSLADAPFRFTYYVSRIGTKVVAEYDGTEYKGCRPTDDGRVVVPFDNHGFVLGKLRVRREFFLTDQDFADGICHTVSEEFTGIEFTKFGNDEAVEVIAEAIPAYIKGEKGEQGIQGEQGEKGDKGDPGQDASVTIVNNLTEGGEDKALSAEMGKALSDRIEEVAENGGGVPIVDSVDKLDSNAPQGSLATVAINTIGEVSFSELYQPTLEDLGLELPPIHKFSRVSGISVIVPDPSIEPPEFELRLVSEDFNPENGVGSIVNLMAGRATLISMSDDSQNMEFELLIYNEEENTLTLNEESLAELNNILSEKGYVYGGTYGPLNEDGDYGLIDPSVSDFIYRAISRVSKTDLYIKNVEGWKIFDDKELKNQISDLEVNLTNLENTVTNLEDKTDLIVNSIDELPEDAPLGAQANVILYNRIGFVPVSRLNFGDRVFEIQGIFPEELPNMPVFTTGGSFALNFVYGSQYVERIVISLNRENMDYVFKGGIPYSNSLELARYNSSKQLISTTPDNINQLNALINSHTYKLDQVYSPSGVNVDFDWGTVLLAKAQKVAATIIYVKNETGWEQYSELLDQSVTTDKVADGSITLDKLSPELQELLNSLKTT